MLNAPLIQMQNSLSATPGPQASPWAGSHRAAGYHFEGLQISATSVPYSVFYEYFMCIFNESQCDSAGLSELLL